MAGREAEKGKESYLPGGGKWPRAGSAVRWGVAGCHLLFLPCIKRPRSKPSSKLSQKQYGPPPEITAPLKKVAFA